MTTTTPSDADTNNNTANATTTKSSRIQLREEIITLNEAIKTLRKDNKRIRRVECLERTRIHKAHKRQRQRHEQDVWWIAKGVISVLWIVLSPTEGNTTTTESLTPQLSPTEVNTTTTESLTPHAEGRDHHNPTEVEHAGQQDQVFSFGLLLKIVFRK